MAINLNNYIYLILINFAICISGYLIYFGLNYLFDFKLIKKIAGKIFKNYKIVFNIFSGIVMGIINFLGIMISYDWYPQTNTIIILYLPILIVVGVSYKPSVFLSYLFSILLSLIAFDFARNISFVNFSFHAILVCVGCCFVVMIKLLKLTNNKIINFSFILVFVGIVILIFYLLIKSQPIENILIQSLFVFALYLFSYFLNYYIENFVNKINELNKSSIFEINNFYKEDVGLKKINESKKIHNIGLMCIINFTNMYNLPIKLGNHLSKYMQQKLLSCFCEALKEFKPIFFVTSKNEYAFYIPYNKLNLSNLIIMYNGNKLKNRQDNDPLLKLENIIRYIPNQLIFDNEIIDVNFNISCSIYGLHSSDNIQLIELSRLAGRSMEEYKNNILRLYNPKYDIAYKVNYKEIEKLQEFFGPDSIEIKLKTNKIGWIYPHVSSVNHLLFDMEDIKSFAVQNNIYSITLRWIAMQTVKQYSKEIRNNFLLVEYPISHILNPNFNIASFKRKLNLLNIDLNKLILKLDCLDIGEWENKVYIFKNLLSISDLGIKMYFVNFDENYSNLIKIIKPDWISINKKYKIFTEYYQKLNSLVGKFGINLI